MAFISETKSVKHNTNSYFYNCHSRKIVHKIRKKKLTKTCIKSLLMSQSNNSQKVNLHFYKFQNI